jgi:hypothetical protein
VVSTKTMFLFSAVSVFVLQATSDIVASANIGNIFFIMFVLIICRYKIFQGKTVNKIVFKHYGYKTMPTHVFAHFFNR